MAVMKLTQLIKRWVDTNVAAALTPGAASERKRRLAGAKLDAHLDTILQHALRSVTREIENGNPDRPEPALAKLQRELRLYVG